jgi:hypothetical protein
MTALLLSCSSAPKNNPPASGKAGDGKISIPQDIAGLVHAGGTRTDEEYALLDKMGVSWIAATFYWDRIEHSRGDWNFSGYDAYVDAAKAHGKKVLAVLAYATDWIHPPGKYKRFVPPTEIPLYVEFVAQTVMRYKGKVDAWQIWNEPNWTFWKGSNKEFFELAKAAAKKVSELDPGTPVLMSGVLRSPGMFVADLLKSGAMQYGSQASFHPYSLMPTGAAGLYDSFARTLAKNGYSGNIWVTEVGFPTGGLYPTRVPEKLFGTCIVKTITLLAVRGARAIFWYQLFDPPREERVPSDSEDFFGLVFPNYEMKPGAESFAECVKNIAGKTYDPSYPARANFPSQVRAFYFEAENPGRSNDAAGKTSRALIMWKSGSAATVRIPMPQDSPVDVRMRVFSTKTEKTTTLVADKTGAAITVTSAPVIVTW